MKYVLSAVGGAFYMCGALIYCIHVMELDQEQRKLLWKMVGKPALLLAAIGGALLGIILTAAFGG